MTRHRLAGGEREPLLGARCVGAADPIERLKVSVLVRRRRSDLASVTKFATGHGLAVLREVAACRAQAVALSGTVAQFNNAFGVDLGESGPPELIEMTDGLLVASWDAVTTAVEPMLPRRQGESVAGIAPASARSGPG
jgi:hypothetical protein